MSIVTIMIEEIDEVQQELSATKALLKVSEQRNDGLAKALKSMTDELNKVATSDPDFWMDYRDKQLKIAIKRMADFGYAALDVGETPKS